MPQKNRKDQLFEFATQKGLDDFRNTAYWDVNSFSIGYGSKRNLQGNPIMAGDMTDPSGAKVLFDRDAESAFKRVDQIGQNLTQNQQVALADLIYNAGFTKFSKSKTYQKLKSGDLPGAAQELLSWGNPKRDKMRHELFMQDIKDKIGYKEVPENILAMLGNPNITKLDDSGKVWRVQQ